MAIEMERMQHARGTAAQWTTANPILLDGELGYESDTFNLKIGDGSHAWSALKYLGTAWRAVSITANYTALPSDYVKADCTSGNITITVPVLASAGVAVERVDNSTNTLTVQCAGLVSGDANATIVGAYTCAIFFGDGTNANVIGAYPSPRPVITASNPVMYNNATQNVSLGTVLPVAQLNDTNGNVALTVGATASAVNSLTLNNAAAGIAPTLTAAGSDANVSLNLVPKGSGTVQINGVPVVTRPGMVLASGAGASANSSNNWATTGSNVLLDPVSGGNGTGVTSVFTVPPSGVYEVSWTFPIGMVNANSILECVLSTAATAGANLIGPVIQMSAIAGGLQGIFVFHLTDTPGASRQLWLQGFGNSLGAGGAVGIVPNGAVYYKVTAL